MIYLNKAMTAILNRHRRLVFSMLLVLAIIIGQAGACQASKSDEAIAYFANSQTGRQEIYQYLTKTLGSDRIVRSDVERAANILSGIAVMADLPENTWQVIVADKDKFNAYALTGNIIVVNKAALEMLNDAELEVILAHEAGHEVLGHPEKGLRLSKLAMSKARSVGKSLAAEDTDTAAAEYWEALQLSRSSKWQERQADEWAARLLAANQRDMNVAVNLWSRLKELYGEPSYASSHLTYKERSKIYAEAARLNN